MYFYYNVCVTDRDDEHGHLYPTDPKPFTVHKRLQGPGHVTGAFHLGHFQSFSDIM